MTRLGRRALAPLALSLAAARMPEPVRPDDRLRVLWPNPVTVLHPYFAATHEASVIAHHVWDTLLIRDRETLQLRPALARAWRQSGPLEFTFTLRDDIAFDDGTPLTAADVVATFRLATTDPRVARPDDFAFVDEAVALDPRTVRLTLNHPFAPALDYLATLLPILPAARVASPVPPGTGPYRLAFVAETRIDLARSTTYPKDGPRAGATLDAISLTAQPDAAARLAAVAAGDADWTWDLGPALFDDAQRDPALTTLKTDTMRFAYLAMDAAGHAGDTPFRSPLVRRAVALGLDRAGIATAASPLGARLLDIACYPTQFGCDPSAAHATTDLAAARAAVADAGYPDGFATDLVSTLPPVATRPVVAALRRLGIEARVTALTPEAALARLGAGGAPLSLALSDGAGINDVSAVLPRLLGGGPYDMAADPEVRALIQHAGLIADPDQRRDDYARALRLVARRALLVPLYAFARTYAFTKQLNFRASPDDIPRFYQASWR